MTGNEAVDKGGLGDKIRTEQGRWRGWIAFVFVAVASYGVLTLPDHPGAFRAYAYLQLPLEVPLILLALLLLPQKGARLFTLATTAVLFTLLFLKLADIGVQSAFQRRFNPYLDGKMLVDGWHLLSGTIGTTPAALAISLMLLGLAGFLVLILKAQWQVIAMNRRARRPAIGISALLLLAGLLLLVAGPLGPVRGTMLAASYLDRRLALVQQSVLDLHAFEKAIDSPDPVAQVAGEPGAFAAVRGRDVILTFVESYGRSAVEDPRYSPLITPRLAMLEEQLADAGFASSSGWLHSPTMGGLSWLAHGTFLSGLRVDSQFRYDRLMISERRSLNRLFRKAGWRTAAVMPAISMDWPEAAYYGYDKVYAAKDLGYRGKPFNWVTMPDQYTLSAFERLVRRPTHAAGKPVMAEIALISSHAPWTPVPHLVNWQDVGDGTVFNPQAESGDSPRVVWADHDRVRDQFILSIDYALETLGDYVARYGEDAVFIILGDHQPAPLITGADASRAVPIHIISRDAALIRRFEADGFTKGMTPDPDAPELPMESMRERLVRLFSAGD